MSEKHERYAVFMEDCRDVEIGKVTTYGDGVAGVKATRTTELRVDDITHYSNAYLETMSQLGKAIEASGMPPEAKELATNKLEELKRTSDRKSFFEKHKALMSILSDYAQVASTALAYAAVLASAVPF